jgi:hypothetical protein
MPHEVRCKEYSAAIWEPLLHRLAADADLISGSFLVALHRIRVEVVVCMAVVIIPREDRPADWSAGP